MTGIRRKPCIKTVLQLFAMIHRIMESGEISVRSSVQIDKMENCPPGTKTWVATYPGVEFKLTRQSDNDGGQIPATHALTQRFDTAF